MITENSNITCPDCRGALKRTHDGNILQYECRVGHTYSAHTAAAAHADTEENALWAAVVALEEGADLLDDVARFLDGDAADNLLTSAVLRRTLAERVREIIKELRPPKLL